MRYLKAGEIVRATDEVHLFNHVWCTGSLNTGKKLPKDKVGLYRRRKVPCKVPLLPMPDDLLSRLKTVLPKVKNGMKSETIHDVRGVIVDCIDQIQS